MAKPKTRSRKSGKTFNPAVYKILLPGGQIKIIGEGQWTKNKERGNLTREPRDSQDAALFAKDHRLARPRTGLKVYENEFTHALVFETAQRQYRIAKDALALGMGVRDLAASNASMMEREFLFAVPTTTREQADKKLRATLPVWSSSDWGYKDLCNGVQLADATVVVELNV